MKYVYNLDFSLDFFSLLALAVLMAALRNRLSKLCKMTCHSDVTKCHTFYVLSLYQEYTTFCQI